MPVRPLCHGRVSRSGRGSHCRPRSGWIRFLWRLGTLLGVQRLDPAEADHPGGHPVGQHDHVALDRLARAELVAHLGEELGVVVDVVGVVDGDPGRSSNVLELVARPCARVDVGRPVGDDQLLVARRRRPWPGTSAGSCSAAGGAEERQHQRGELPTAERGRTPAPLQNAAAGRPASVRHELRRHADSLRGGLALGARIVPCTRAVRQAIPSDRSLVQQRNPVVRDPVL